MFEGRFAHYLAYGATDQQTIHELTGRYTGLIVPGTIAAFHRSGTGGFVLALSATESHTPYVIDPRFPLFQQQLPSPKKSHIELAKIFVGEDLPLSALVSTDVEPDPSSFSDGLLDAVTRNWVNFNLNYRDVSSQKFEKYARRLGEDVVPSQASEPRYILPPYLIYDGRMEWWLLSSALYDRALRILDPDKCIRVVATVEPHHLGELLGGISSEKIVVWVSGLNEFTTSSALLAEYAAAIQSNAERGKKLFALYGGFFSVILSCVGLVGSCHGIGYGEHRNYLELPQSGPAPPRYYFPGFHRYVSQEFAHRLWQLDKAWVECDCPICNGQSPLGLDYHSLMKHSVLCRAKEIEEWVGLDLEQTRDKIDHERTEFLSRLGKWRAPELFKGEVRRSASHLHVWSEAIRSL